MSKCIYCGTSLRDWKDHGKIGCAHCLNLFQSDYIRYIPSREKEDWEPPKRVPLFKEWKKLSSEPIHRLAKRIDSWKLPFSYRFRITRNPKGSVYPIRLSKSIAPEKVLQKCLPDILEEILSENETESSNTKRSKSFSETIAPRSRSNNRIRSSLYSNGGRLLFGDEDQVRWEFVTDSLFELETVLNSNFLEKFWKPQVFDYKEGIGYISSCPTNSGEGDKLSVAIPFGLSQTGELDGFVLPENWGFYREDVIERIVFFRKNFGLVRKNSFFNFVSYLALLVRGRVEGEKSSHTCQYF
ncbi:hypothetical protein CH373_01730 [Leptospira perolatii]|uniref:ATP--guanido phosphotransferase n=1 Tax=Leptospira perolatii TaxID=2023191 RepID=A0A2M9ZT10_9LEPT|nr:ATP--guanido phosphotransferase [Leptospira perolatii]PJZ71580.1 hypothetical protein CH360_01730 [Leptospira perolatii]PJZ75196.1 hypothetical protein CH373_01730 [Leptospira perolatii]